MDFRKEIEINKLKLDDELIRLPNSNYECHEELSKKIKERDNVKLELEVLEAEIDKEIRDNSEKKPSENQIKNMVLMDKRRIKKVREYNGLNEEVNVLKGATNSFDKKDKAITNLIKMYTTDFYIKDFRKSQRNSLNK